MAKKQTFPDDVFGAAKSFNISGTGYDIIDHTHDVNGVGAGGENL